MTVCELCSAELRDPQGHFCQGCLSKIVGAVREGKEEHDILKALREVGREPPTPGNIHVQANSNTTPPFGADAHIHGIRDWVQ